MALFCALLCTVLNEAHMLVFLYIHIRVLHFFPFFHSPSSFSIKLKRVFSVSFCAYANRSLFCCCLFGACMVPDYCVSASAAPKRITVEVISAVKTSKNSTEELCNKTQSYIDVTKVVLQRAELFKTKAANVEYQAAQALSQAEAAAEKNSKAKDIIAQIKRFSNTVSTLHNEVTGELKNTEEKLKELFSKATTLKGQCDKEPKIKASDIKTKVDQLDSFSNSVVDLMNGVDATAKTMTQSLKDAQLANLHVNVIVAFDNIGTMMEKADSIIKEIKNKKVEVNGVVEELQTLRQTAPSELNKSINALYKNAEDELTKVTGAVEKAEEAQKKIKKEKEHADTALKNFPTKSQVSEARTELEKVEASVEKLNGIVEQLKSELLKADNYIKNAKDLKQQIKTALSTTTGKPSTEQSEKTENSASTVRQSTETDQKDTTVQPTSKELPSQSDKSTEEVKDALIKGAQNVPTTALTGEKAPAPGANNDSAMTVSVPLLVALIASAALQ